MSPASPSSSVPPATARGGAISRATLLAACLLILSLYALFANLKGIGTDEGFRLGIINGGKEFTINQAGSDATWADVLKANTPYAYQPLYFLIQNSVMRVAHTHDEGVLKGVNIFFLGLSLLGILALTREWSLLARLFALGLFGLNSYLFMHVLQLREYIAGIAFYVWSTWLTLHLDARRLERPAVDLGWFAGYGVLLVVGFFTQSWAVFPAIGQGLFLVARRPGNRLRFYLHLAVSYAIVLSATLPYLLHHRQKVDIGKWGSETTRLWPWLVDGFHLVLSGQSFGTFPTTDRLFWLWLVLAAAGVVLLASGKPGTGVPSVLREGRRQAALMLLCLGVSVAFQIWYFVKVDTLSVWPRYFALHYFFLIWLVVLGFNRLHTLATAPTLRTVARKALQLTVVVLFALMAYSGFFQSRAYYRDPYFDSGISQWYNWRLLNASLGRILQPGDTVLTQDFLHAWTLTFTRPLPNPVFSAPQLESAPRAQVKRFVYLVSTPDLNAHRDVINRLAALGYGTVHAEELFPAAAAASVPNWRALIFERP